MRFSPTMKPHKTNQQTRTVVAVALFATALVSSIAITTLGNRTEGYWVATHGITPGAVISKMDVEQTKVNLGALSHRYLSSDQSPIGAVALNQISDGDLISIGELTTQPQSLLREVVPLRVLVSDIPGDIAVGELVHIYWVPENSGLEIAAQPQAVLRSVYLRSIDRKGSSFGSEIAITISLDSDQVIPLLATTSAGRIVVVRSHG